MERAQSDEELIGSTRVPGEGVPLCLYKYSGGFEIRVGDTELMNSCAHESEDALASLVCGRLTHLPAPHILIGGLGMGYTLAAALKGVGPKARVVVGELVPAIVEWNRGPLAHLAGSPLKDPRVSLHVGDVSMVLQTEEEEFDGILLDVDNGPDGLTRDSNNWLYSEEGLSAAYSALRPGGILAIWSSGPDRSILIRLSKIGFDPEAVKVADNTIWLATRRP